MKLTKVSTLNLHGYSIEFCPGVSTDYLACAASSNYGLSGPGELLIFQDTGRGYFPIQKCAWTDAIFDLAWKPFSEDIIATGSGDGNLQIWSFKYQREPCLVLKGHLKEVSSLNWSKLTEDVLLLSSSWDESIRVWDVVTGNQLCIFLGHDGIVYEAAWSPHKYGIFASVGGDKSICLWDVRAPELLPQKVTAHTSDVLTIDWSILNEHIVATGGIDHFIEGWDLRQLSMPVFQIIGHESAVRRVRFSPFQRNVLASVSYDFSTRFWDWLSGDVMHVYDQHTEFVYGLGFSPTIPGKVADCSWDGFIHIYDDINTISEL